MKSIKFLLISIAAIFLSASSFAQTGTVRGKIIDNSNGESLPFATVFVKEAQQGATTDFEGTYTLELQAGKYTLEVSYVGYTNTTVSDVVVKAGETNVLDIRMGNDAQALAEVVVTAKMVKNSESALLTMQKKSPNLMDGISNQTFKRIGDNDAGGAIKRVTGVSVEGGKYVYVRGLGDRYTKTLLNGLDIPGLDPDRNSIQMDLFPTNIIDNMVVLKTATPNLTGDFTGGIVDITTKDFPVAKSFSISLGGSYNPSMHFNDNYVEGNKSSTDWLGFDNGVRDLPIDSKQVIPSFTARDEALTTLTKRFNPSLGVNKTTSPMNFIGSLSTGNQVNFKKFTLGYNVALNYRNETTFYKEVQYNYYIKGINPQTDYDFDLNQMQRGSLGINNVLLSGLAGLAIKFDKSKIAVNALRIQNGESTAGKFTKQTFILNSATLSQDNVEYSERSIMNFNIKGEHSFGDANDFKIDWTFSPTQSKIDDKDVRVTPFRYDDGEYTIEPSEGAQPRRLYRSLTEKNYSGRIDFTKKFVTNHGDSKLRFGVGNTLKNRDYEILQYVFNIRGQSQFDINGDPNKVLAPENIWNKDTNLGVYVVGNYEPANTYSARQNIASAYVMNELKLTEKLNAIYGLRVEKFDHHYTGQSNLGDEVYDNVEINSALDFLPSANFVYALKENTNLRVAVARTLARPSFKEASISQIYDALSDRTYIGNKDLKETKIMNYDLRYEKYMDNGQMISLSGFYKQFKDPIEVVAYSQAAPNDITPRNVGKATVFGAEVELRKNLGLHVGSELPLSVGANVTYVNSKVKMNPNEYQSRLENARLNETIKDSRNLQGQSPYIANAFVTYNHQEGGIEANLSYNVQGKRLSIVGIGRNPDIFEMPFNSLNFKATKRFGAAQRGFVSVSVNNILDAKKRRFYEGYQAESQIYDLFRPGRAIGLKVGYTL
ncbi:TonB-dependent receptor [Marinilongibacter aquaticus]|uniref:TonB-dependent receptor n=1 Tax=Marinilongibacter aquaticus TaxID=2975157 RepID=UPI0021BDC925|nr:TonB-dependent receptor [Marinilongibacter aquaticus]UBM58852.1 TonB-dependent receptor [Marinilongibacter aquaticus]